jgi:hypothetical protein
MGRLIFNHSTHIKGLIKFLQKFVDHPKVKSITPGRISQTKSQPCPLKLKITVPIVGGFKIVARSERAAQEVFVICDLSREELERLLLQ